MRSRSEGQKVLSLVGSGQEKKKTENVSLSYTERWSDWDLNPSIVWLHVLKSLDCFTQLHVDIDCTQEWSAANVVTLNSSETSHYQTQENTHSPPTKYNLVALVSHVPIVSSICRFC